MDTLPTTRPTATTRWSIAGRIVYSRPVVVYRNGHRVYLAPPSLGGRLWVQTLQIGSLEETLELPNSRRVTHLAQRFRLDLANAFARDAKLPAHFLERAAVAVDQSKPLFEHLALAIGQGLEDVFDLLF